MVLNAGSNPPKQGGSHSEALIRTTEDACLPSQRSRPTAAVDDPVQRILAPLGLLQLLLQLLDLLLSLRRRLRGLRGIRSSRPI